MNQYLLEVGTEELPVTFLKTASDELLERVRRFLEEEQIACQDVQVWATPRRLTLKLSGVAEMQQDRPQEIKGPPVKVALDGDGKPTQAGLGFAKKMNVSFDSLLQEERDGERYLILRQTIPGRATKDCLSEQLPELILGLSGSHFMAWGSSTIKFSRPIRWLVSLWNDQLMPLEIGTLRAGTHSRGHRVLAQQESIAITSIATYTETLSQIGSVVVEPEKRKALIWEQLQRTAEQLGGRVVENPELLDTVCLLVESPNVVVGGFESRFLNIPAEVIVTVMAAHQKYFPVYHKTDDTLLPYFLTISNGPVEAAESIRKGNERVLVARLEDARFFFEEDRKLPLTSRVEMLKGITFQKGLGTLFDKTQRLVTLSGQVAEALGYSADIIEQAQRAALLSKTDLTTGMVRELTELQGGMGQIYARLAEEPAAVADAIFEQYLPRFVDDQIAKSPVGIALSIADKLDTLVAVFSQKNARLPSGSKDPLALRRMAAGIIQTVLDNGCHLDLLKLAQAAHAELGPFATQPFNEMLPLLSNFINQRFKGFLLEQSIRYDIIDAVLEASDALGNLYDVQVRAQFLKQWSQDSLRLKLLYEPANRTARILGDAYQQDIHPSAINSTHFRDPSESALFEAIGKIPKTEAYTQETYQQLAEALADLSPQIDRFFENVLINDPDPEIKANRYGLLSLLNQLYLNIAAFQKLVC